MTIRFEYYSNTEDLNFDPVLRQPMNIVYTMMTEIPVVLSTIPSIFSFFDNLESILDQSLQNDQVQKDRATRQMIEQLGPYHRVSRDSNLLEETCAICLDKFTPCEGYRTLICGHDFHKRCIDKWFLEGSQECPCCRKNAWGNIKKENDGTS